MPRLNLNMNAGDMILKLSDGNPGAMTVLNRGFVVAAGIDPDSFFGPFTLILPLDDMGIYGHRIWMLFKDVCKQNFVLMGAVLRANQLGLITMDTLNHAIDNYGEGIDVNALHTQVCERLPNFKKELES
jgi:hypothetical protein